MFPSHAAACPEGRLSPGSLRDTGRLNWFLTTAIGPALAGGGEASRAGRGLHLSRRRLRPPSRQAARAGVRPPSLSRRGREGGRATAPQSAPTAGTRNWLPPRPIAAAGSWRGAANGKLGSSFAALRLAEASGGGGARGAGRTLGSQRGRGGGAGPRECCAPAPVSVGSWWSGACQWGGGGGGGGREGRAGPSSYRRGEAASG